MMVLFLVKHTCSIGLLYRGWNNHIVVYIVIYFLAFVPILCPSLFFDV